MAKTVPKRYTGECRNCDKEVRVTINQDIDKRAPEGYRVRCNNCATTNWVET